MKNILALILVAASFSMASPEAFSITSEVKKMTLFMNKGVFTKERRAVGSKVLIKAELEDNSTRFYSCDTYKKLPPYVVSRIPRRMRLKFCVLIDAHNQQEEADLKKHFSADLWKILVVPNSKKQRIDIINHEDISSAVYATDKFNAYWAIQEVREAYSAYRPTQEIND